MVACRNDVPWIRKHDPPDRHISGVTVCYPTNLRELIELCTDPPGDLKAAGSHYALSGAAISDGIFIETNDPRDEMPAMARTLHDVLPEAMNPRLFEWLTSREIAYEYPIHVEAGKRLYQLYAELDWNVGHDPRSLARHIERENGRSDYLRRWAIPTMGSAAQQTIVGAFSTGTHGGDVKLPPVSDIVQAIHLVLDGGRHLWIERLDRSAFGGAPIVDDALLHGVYNQQTVGRDIEIVRDNELFDAVLVSAGRFGVIYSVVLAVVPQFTLHENTALDWWGSVKSKIVGRSQSIWLVPDRSRETRYLNIIVSLSPTSDGNRAGVIRRWKVDGISDAGVAERRGYPSDPPYIDARIDSPYFPMAGRSREFKASPEVTLIESACSSAGFMQGVIIAVLDEIEEFLTSEGFVVGAGIAAIALAGGAGLIALAPYLWALVHLLRRFLEEFDFDDSTIADAVEALRELVMGVVAETGLPAPTFVWRMITDKLFVQQMTKDDREGVSYAVLDTHDYLEKNCFVDVDSLEVFFDEDERAAIAYVDSLIAFERRQQAEGLTFFGVAALRFTSGTTATLGPQQWPRTVSVEVAGLNGVDGTAQLMRFATLQANDMNFGGFLHWGQRNETTPERLWRFFQHRREVGRYPGDNLVRWQQQLARYTNNGTLKHFSSRQTRSWGLEVS